ncbi:MAG: pseudouridine synthase [Rikenellaceae bacterium]
MNSSTILHSLDGCSVAQRPLNSPFRYTPSVEVVAAQREIVEHLNELASSDLDIAEELARGKMLGALVVVDECGSVGYLAGFSGCMAGRLELDGFVPPIFGRGEVNERFTDGDRAIGELGRRIAEMESSEELVTAKAHLQAARQSAEAEQRELADWCTEAKRKRDIDRKNGDRTPEELQLESARQKGEVRRRKLAHKALIEQAEESLKSLLGEIEQLRIERRNLSYTLQREMFESYSLINGRGETKSLYAIFNELNGTLPPSGTGECAAPKLLHYAMTHRLTPISIGEFWFGGTPSGEVRHHNHFYGACKSRCEPILCYMLQGVNVEPLTTLDEPSLRDKLAVVFEDQHFALFNKPSGMLSVQGCSAAESLASIARELYPDATGSMVVHRLDQDTSGLILIAKSEEVHKALQRQFMERSLEKRYIAVVEGVTTPDQGEIELPLIPNIDDRPRHKVDHRQGKKAHTTFRVIERYENSTRLELTPHTGRTHQLRIHCAHSEGLSAPIIGDRLYGNSGERLLLHAAELTLRHPITGEVMHFCAPAEF